MLSEIQATHGSSHGRGVGNVAHFSGLFLHLDHYKEGQGDGLEMMAMSMAPIHSPFKMSHEPQEWLPHSWEEGQCSIMFLPAFLSLSPSKFI